MYPTFLGRDKYARQWPASPKSHYWDSSGNICVGQRHVFDPNHCYYLILISIVSYDTNRHNTHCPCMSRPILYKIDEKSSLNLLTLSISKEQHLVLTWPDWLICDKMETGIHTSILIYSLNRLINSIFMHNSRIILEK